MMYKKQNFKLYLVIVATTLCVFASFAQTSQEYVKKAWTMQGKGDHNAAINAADKCIDAFSKDATALSADLTDFPPKGKEDNYQIMNDVAICYFIKGETLRNMAVEQENETKEETLERAIATLEEVIEKYPYAQAFDPRGWYWSIKEKAENIIIEINQGDGCKIEENTIQQDTEITLYDEGSEFPVNYERYGEFSGLGTDNYRYTVNDPIELAKATGEGVYPNSTSIKFDPEFVKLKKGLSSINHWEILNSRDLNTAFYRWSIAPEPTGVKQFYIADILERAGLFEHAIKAYYSVIVHFPKTYSWTYWHTPWYPSKAAIYRIKHIIEENPEINLRLQETQITIQNGYDNSIRNDVYIVNPGKLTRTSFLNKGKHKKEKRNDQGKIVKTIGGDISKLVKYANGDWKMIVNQKPFIIKGITYDPSRVGESPDKGTKANWTTQDTNKNNIIDAPFESWVDENGNNVQDENEESIGDFALMKEMGANCLRLYHQPEELNKKLLRQMHEKYGIYIVMGDFLGKYVLGSGADWEKGTDYENALHKENMLKSVEKMVQEFKDEPYVVMWLLGNENVYGLGCNADKKPESFFKFVNDAALLIKSLDPYKRPVGIVSGDVLFLDVFAKECPDVDVFGTNAYRGRHGFLDLWNEVKKVVDKPLMLTEFGAPSYATGYTIEETEQYQAKYHKTCWEDIYYNSAYFGEGNAIGGFVFEWIDEWWKAYSPHCHDTARLSAGPFLDGYYREEWFGLCGQGDGTKSPFLRHLKKAYYVYKDLWNNN
ncbi:MAG: hypothetical protein GY858_07670 [Candidatus Omnitrophica bacterium]|nr:hypothetical protein [Candidatus Omnitrophota bacterium]